MTPSPQLTVRLMGEFEVRVAGDPLALPSGAQRLVAMLSLRRRSTRTRLAGWLWPDTTQTLAMGRLRTTIWRANHAAPGLVESVIGGLDVASGALVDVRRLVDDAHAVLVGDAHALAVDDFPSNASELLPDWDDEWLAEDREWLRQLRLHALEARARELTMAGSYGLALEWALSALRADPLRESAHRAVIVVHLAEGNLGEARRAYARCVEVLATELGVSPTRETVAALSLSEAELAARAGVTSR